jgi:hypothetical protein
MRNNILALDPGKKTGWALASFKTDGSVYFQSGEQTFLENASFVHTTAASTGDELSVVSESFTITVNTAKNTQATWSLELIGIYRYLSLAYCREDLTLQAPAAAKRFSSDDRLRAMGWYTPGKGHANDAARHLMLYMVTRKWWDDRLAV